MKTGHRYECRRRCARPDVGNGQPRRKACSWCGGAYIVHEGVWGVFEWSGQGRYPVAEAKSLHSQEWRASKATDGTDLVVRWVDARDLEPQS